MRSVSKEDDDDDPLALILLFAAAVVVFVVVVVAVVVVSEAPLGPEGLEIEVYGFGRPGESVLSRSERSDSSESESESANGKRPSASSISEMPRDHTSDLTVYCAPCIRSGLSKKISHELMRPRLKGFGK